MVASVYVALDHVELTWIVYIDKKAKLFMEL